MNIFNKVTIKYLKKNKIRTLATIMGILLSSAMICAVATFLSSMNQYVIENAIYNTGDWQVGLNGVDWAMCETLSQNEEVTGLVYNQRIGYGPITELKNEYKCYYYLLGVKKEFLDTMCAHITAGRFPRTPQEILMPESLFENSNMLNYQIGDKIVLSTGVRTYKNIELTQDDPYVFDDDVNYERFGVEKTLMYTIVGFYDDLSYQVESASAPGYTVFTCFEERPAWRDNYEYDVYFNMNNIQKIYDFVEKEELTATYNVEVLGVMGILQQGSSKNTSLIIAGFIICLILVGAIALIYNMFSISVSERTKQFGLMASIGATQKQIQKMILFEAFCVSFVGIPLGILSGIGGIWIALKFIGDKFEALGFSIPMTMQVSLVAVLSSVVISFITVIISVWIPSKRAMQMNVIENIRQNKDVYQTKKKEKEYEQGGKWFGISGILAKKYCIRSKKKYQAAVLSLTISFILFITVTCFMDYLLQVIEHNFDENTYDIAFFYEQSADEGLSQDELIELMQNEGHITDAVYTTTTKTYRVEMEKKYLNSWALENIGTLTRSSKLNPEIVTLGIDITFIQDEVFLDLLEQYGVNHDEFMDFENPKALVIDHTLNSNTNTSVSILEGDDCLVSFNRTIYKKSISANGYEHEFLSELLMFDLVGGKTIYERPYYLEGQDGLMFLYPESVRQYYIGKYPEKSESVWEDPVKKQNDYSRLVEDNISHLKFRSSNVKASYEALQDIAKKHNINENNIMSNAIQIEKEGNLIFIIQVLAFGFLILMSLVAAINVFNTMSTNISLRRREFAVLKSIGMTQIDLRHMMFVEGMLLGRRALLYGFPISFLGTMALYKLILAENGIAYRFPWISIVISIVVIWAIECSTILYIMREKTQENVIETLKNENI